MWVGDLVRAVFLAVLVAMLALLWRVLGRIAHADEAIRHA